MNLNELIKICECEHDSDLQAYVMKKLRGLVNPLDSLTVERNKITIGQLYQFKTLRKNAYFNNQVLMFGSLEFIPYKSGFCKQYFTKELREILNFPSDYVFTKDFSKDNFQILKKDDVFVKYFTSRVMLEKLCAGVEYVSGNSDEDKFFIGKNFNDIFGDNVPASSKPPNNNPLKNNTAFGDTGLGGFGSTAGSNDAGFGSSEGSSLSKPPTKSIFGSFVGFGQSRPTITTDFFGRPIDSNTQVQKTKGFTFGSSNDTTSNIQNNSKPGLFGSSNATTSNIQNNTGNSPFSLCGSKSDTSVQNTTDLNSLNKPPTSGLFGGTNAPTFSFGGSKSAFA